MRQKIQQLCLRFGYEVRKFPDAFKQQKKLLAGIPNPVIFDVGAHHGYVTTSYNNLFPDASIYSFEPFAESFAILKNRTRHIPAIHPYNLAVSNQVGTAVFRQNLSSNTNSLLPSEPNAPTIWGKGKMETQQEITVQTTTLDQFTKENHIDRIDLLKLDVQGAEYLVLEGAKELAQSGKIGVIYTEIITSPAYTGQKPFCEILSQLYGMGFCLYNFYNIYPPADKAKQMDAIFVKNR